MDSSSTTMQGKICLVTGATAGIGVVTAQALAQMGATVIVHGRSQEKCIATVNHIRAATSSESVDYLLADLSSQAQIRAFVAQFHQRYNRLDVLVNNAGGAYVWRQESVDGIEMTFALNHLNYFLLTNLLLDTIKASAPARIVNVSSNSHYEASINFDDLEGKRRYWWNTAYGQSKLANVLFTYELARRLEGSNVTTNALHPGFVATNIGKNNGALARLFLWFVHRTALSPEEGARTSIYLATSPEVAQVTGKYFVKERPVESDPASNDLNTARRLWEISAEMTGL
jgi:NAD(P)-dependent dehydrogenase (short-subunit alcohol dehydrogenase family)